MAGRSGWARPGAGYASPWTRPGRRATGSLRCAGPDRARNVRDVASPRSTPWLRRREAANAVAHLQPNLHQRVGLGETGQSALTLIGPEPWMSVHYGVVSLKDRPMSSAAIASRIAASGASPGNGSRRRQTRNCRRHRLEASGDAERASTRACACLVNASHSDTIPGGLRSPSTVHRATPFASSRPGRTSSSPGQRHRCSVRGSSGTRSRPG